jgi:beta-lactamase class D
MRRLFLVLAACGSSSTSPPAAGSGSGSGSAPPPAPTKSAIADKKPDLIAPLWPDGCFMTLTRQSDATRCATPRRPYSTFKLANALIGLDAGVLKEADTPMTWDRKRVADESWYQEEWRKPQTLGSAFKLSAVPYFRTLALDLGDARMKAGLAKLHYGNQDISGGLDKFWLAGGLRISAVEQIQFVDALAHDKLDMSKHAQAVVREISIIDRNGDRVLHGKTGSGHAEDGKGWLVWQVGWVEHGNEIKPYAAWLEVADGTVEEARAKRTKRLDDTLAALGWFTKP